MIFLAAAGSIAAGMHYYTVDLPQQKANEEYARCSGGCISSNVVISTPLGPQSPTDEACQEKCRARYLHR